MIKCFFVFFSSSYIGFLFSNKLKKEKEILKELIRFNQEFILNLEHNKLSLLEFIVKFKKGVLSDIIRVFENYLINNEELNYLNLVSKELNLILISYFENLGQTNYNSQKNFLNNYTEIFNEKVLEFNEKNNKKISLYPKLGVISGAIIFIVLL